MKCLLCASKIDGPDHVCAACVARIEVLRRGEPEQYMTLALESYGFWWERVGQSKTLVRTATELRAYEGKACAALLTYFARLRERQ